VRSEALGVRCQGVEFEHVNVAEAAMDFGSQRIFVRPNC
jgi:hypothetical protein